MVRPIPGFPRPGIEFRHVLDISQKPGGLALCMSLLQSQLTDWANISAIACCEAGGFIFASALALQVKVPLTLIREAGKPPPPSRSSLLLSHDMSKMRYGTRSWQRGRRSML